MKKTLNVLVVFEAIPERTYKAVVEMTNKEYLMFKKANEYVINDSDFNEEKDAVTNVINNAFCDKPKHIKYCETETEKKYFGKFKNTEDIQDIKDVDKLIWCGFYM